MKNYPLIKYVLIFILGILVARYFSFDIIIVLSIAVIFGLTGLTLLLFKPNLPVFASLAVLFLPLFSGYIIYKSYDADRPDLFPQNFYKQKNFTAYAAITKIELLRDGEIVFTCQTDSIKINNHVIKKDVNLLCKIRDSNRALDSVYSVMYPGNIISIKGTYNKGREERNPGEFDYNKYLNSQGISGVLTAYNVEDFKIIHEQHSFFKSLIFNLRKYLDYKITALHDNQTAALLKGLILADRSGMGYETNTNFINSGVVHILSVSGLHVVYVALIFIFLFGRLNPYLRSALILTGLLFYMFIAGVSPPVFRSTVMAAALVISFVFNRSSNIFNSLALSAFIILIFSPEDIFNPGFQLSFSAVLSIAVLYPLIQEEINKWNIKRNWIKWLLLFSGVSLSAQIGTLPFTLAYFNKLSVIALLANLLVVPLSGAILGAGFFTLLISVISMGLASIPAAANELFSELLFAIVNWSGGVSFSYIPIRQFSTLDAVIFYTLLITSLVFYNKFSKAYAKIIFLFLITCNILLLCSLDNKELLSRGDLNVLMIDVGQGDSFLIQFPDGKTALVDAGEAAFHFDNGERVILPLLNHLGIEKIDYAFISHMDSDHYSGFVSLIHAGIIKKIIKPPLDSLSSKDLKFESYARKNKVPVEYYKNEKYYIGTVQIYILNNEADKTYNSFSINNKSGVLKLVYGRTSILFTGDIERRAEKHYSAYYKNFLKSDILKVAHHGSITSSAPEFIAYSRPAVSLTSAGIQNKFNHPSGIILSRLRAAGSKIHRTDIEGAVLYKSNGDSIYYVNWKDF